MDCKNRHQVHRRHGAFQRARTTLFRLALERTLLTIRRSDANLFESVASPRSARRRGVFFGGLTLAGD